MEKKKKVNNKATLFCFTDFGNNNGYEDHFNENRDYIRGMAWGKEICPSTGRPHNQGFIQLFHQDRWNTILSIFGFSHIEACKGSLKSNEDYCKKEGEYTHLGNFVRRGYRSDLVNIKQDLKNGATLSDVMDNYTGDFVRYTGGIKAMKTLIDKDSRNCWRSLSVYSLTGEAGCGKTSFVYKTEGYKNVFTVDQKMMKTDFWGTYDGETVLLIDDFSGWIPYSYLLRILDGHPLSLNVKNGNTFAAWTKVYITSNVKPGMWYRTSGDNLKRRFGNQGKLPDNNIFENCLEVTKGNTKRLSHPWIRCVIADEQYADLKIDN